MASIIPGFEYDIFISYRQKDNKYDGWVTEFVDNLKKELESAFKDDISVYFDVNPHDGLLETHDVIESLKRKLKCLVFIPILSRTYCDPRAFAWENEFKAFIREASADRFGLKINLHGGNVASRVVPVRINDLETSDIILCEAALGGVLRGVDFIYKEAGVNRPLRVNEENAHDNLNHTIYRNQINKTALAVKDILTGLKESVSREVEKKKVGEQKPEIDEIVHNKTVEKERDQKNRTRVKTGIRIGVILLFIIAVTVYIIFRFSMTQWSRTTALTNIEQFANELNYPAAFGTVLRAEKYAGKYPELLKLTGKVVSKLNILTDPPGADAFIKEYSDTSGVWKKLGKTPIDSARLPSRSIYIMKLQKKGYETAHAVLNTSSGTFSRKLFREGEVPEGMVYVDFLGNRDDESEGAFPDKSDGFFIDKYEVTNKQFKKFIDKGGYRSRDYWKAKFIKEGRELSWDEAMKDLTDNTGVPGPSTWEGGDYPRGQEDYPVSGVSWYEAAAYAVYAGKDLPTSYHWRSAAGIDILYSFCNAIISASNVYRKGPLIVGSLKGINAFGTYDMAGNVREWCSNTAEIGHIVRGGAWDDPNAAYLFSFTSQIPSFDRSAKNGFRCVKYIDKSKIPEAAFIEIKIKTGRDYDSLKAVSDNVFAIYRNYFMYDNGDLEPRIMRLQSEPDRKLEKITFNAAYENERITAYLFLPVNATPPFQVIVFFPGNMALNENDILANTGPMSKLDFLVRTGRAVMIPSYKGTYDRIDNVTSNVPSSKYQYREDAIKWVKDFSRSLDYLQTRNDIDTSRIGFMGIGWGARFGSVIGALEKRLKLGIFIMGGFSFRSSDFPSPEVEEHNYVPRIKMPVLMLNGEYDNSFPVETTVMPFYRLLGTPDKDKAYRIYKTDHVPNSEIIKESLPWLDRYFGPVRLTSDK